MKFDDQPEVGLWCEGVNSSLGWTVPGNTWWCHSLTTFAFVQFCGTQRRKVQAIHGVRMCPVEVPKHEDIVLRLWRRLPEAELCDSLRWVLDVSSFWIFFTWNLLKFDEICIICLFCIVLCCLRLDFGCPDAAAKPLLAWWHFYSFLGVCC